MRKIIIALIALLPLLATAQNTWEMPEEQENAEKQEHLNESRQA